MEMKLPIRPFEKAGIVHDHVRLGVQFDRSAMGPVLYLQAAGMNDGAFRFAVFQSPSARLVLERGWPRANAKRLAAAGARVRAEVEGRAGPAWDAVASLLAAAGSAAAEPGQEGGLIAAGAGATAG